MTLSNLLSTKLFDLKQIIRYTSFFAFSILLLNLAAKIISLKVDFGFYTYWPSGVFHPRFPTIENIIVAIVAVVIFTIILRNYTKILSRTSYFYGAIVLLILLSNLIQGFEEGFTGPVSGGDSEIQYYHDAVEIESTMHFISQFENIQVYLRRHSQIHPPGAVLFYYGALQIGLSAWQISVLILIISAGISLFALRRIFRLFLPNEDLGYNIFLYFLIPSIQIYYLATLDALIASFLLLTLSFLLTENGFSRSLSTISVLSIALFLNFASLFIFPVIFGYEFFRKKRLNKSLIILGGVTAIYSVLYFTLGYNYLNSLLIASKLENPDGFRLFSEPIKYVFSRFESVVEPLIFIGPFLIILFKRGLPILKKNQPDFYLLSLLGIGSLCLMFIAGAYRIGESARAALFIYPYLLFPVISYMNERGKEENEWKQLLTLVFAQTIFMQLSGYFFW